MLRQTDFGKAAATRPTKPCLTAHGKAPVTPCNGPGNEQSTEAASSAISQMPGSTSAAFCQDGALCTLLEL